MKKSKLIWSMSFFLLLFLNISCSKSDDKSGIDENCNFTSEQEEGLKYMREEEKLARDVYYYLYEKWGLDIFNHIGSSEQSHMDLVLNLMNKCGIEDISLNDYGKFSNTHLQELYDQLVAAGEQSLIDALKVGATIEDVDIFDLDKFASETQNESLLEVYEKLNCGSRNHMRAFNKQLNSRDASYTPQYISQSKFDEILNSSQESCGS
ncbi:MAG TPA: DUF2202 domain-containing protein [Saprospiraceae bacterium]|nr:DUF2202 domain-containing protein [Saprospiraceae bacterium]HRX29537.1 DUF2202 domain-containing protein [Saprospiraceae bacterium]